MKHGKSKTREFTIWVMMRERCYNTKHIYYQRYGGRGIKMCKEWRNDFVNFLNDMGDSPTSKHTIDRIDNDGNYCKKNCKWSTRKEQCRNRSTTRLITHNGKTQTMREWGDEYHIHPSTFWDRLTRQKLSIEEALVI